MRRLTYLLSVLSLTGPMLAATADPPPGPPGPPLYQMRERLPAGDRTATTANGQTLFSNRCGACHLLGGMGTNLLTKERMQLGESPAMGMLTNRQDLTELYVKTVVRYGKLAMPRQTRVDVTDSELDAIAKFLGKAGQ